MLAQTERAWVSSTGLNLEFKHRQVVSNSPAVKQHSSPWGSLSSKQFHLSFTVVGCSQWFFFIFTLLKDFGMLGEAAVLTFSDILKSFHLRSLYPDEELIPALLAEEREQYTE